MHFCSNWYEEVHENKIFSSIIPSDNVKCTPVAGPSDTTFMIQYGLMFSLIFVLFILYRSCSKKKTDWYRMIAVYIIGTFSVPLLLTLVPVRGFNRGIGIAILLHNTAEWVILLRIWYGMRSKLRLKYSAILGVVYFWLLITLDTFVPLVPLFLILTIQGAFLDWALTITFFWCGNYIQHDKGSYFWFGFAAALLHVLTIQPLFFGFATAITLLQVITVIFVVPTFMLYLWFSSADSDRPLIVVDPREQVDEIAVEISSSLTKQRDPVTDNKKNDDNTVTNDNNNNHHKKHDSKKTPESFVLEYGLLSQMPNAKKTQQIVFLLGFIFSLINSFIVIFSPCFINTSKYGCKH